MLFAEVPFLERFDLAARAGFDAVEFWWPAGQSLDDIEYAVSDNGLEVALFNFYAGDMSSGDRGLLSDPERESAFRENVPVALEFAKQIGCKQLNALVGVLVPGISPSEQLELAASNLRWAARQAARHEVGILVEPLNTFENGPYLVSCTDEGVSLLDKVDEANVGLQYDVYHMQRMEGNLTDTIRNNINRIAHVQIADSPGRGEPGTGEINYPYVFRVLEEAGYRGRVGLEYRPTTETTEQSLEWMNEWIS